MKKLLPVLAITGLVLSVAAQTRSQDVSVNFFYDNLSGGNWIEVGNYGYCWQPDLAVNDHTWRPYADGYWAYTDDGWTWVSYEDFGWATYHYGRWFKLADYGWVWKPGYEWGPAWVSWRTGGNYIGWAPLPPETEYVYESRPLTGHLDIEFDIGPAHYNFIDVRYIGEPVLRSRIVPYQQNVTYISQTVNVTNITYKNATVYNYGPDVNVMNQYSSRPIQRLKLERQANVDVSAAAKSGGLTKVQGNSLVVAAPGKLSKPAQAIAPPTVKTNIAQAKIENGWSEVGDVNAQTQLRDTIKAQDLKNVPSPTLGAPVAKPSVAPKASPEMSGSTTAETSPKGKGKGKNKGNNAEQMQSATPLGAETSPAVSPEVTKGGKKKGKRGEQNQAGAVASPAASGGVGTSSVATPESEKPGKGRKNRHNQLGGTPSPTGSATNPEGTSAPEMKQKDKGKNVGASASETIPQGISEEPRGGVKPKKLEQQQPGFSPSDQTGGASAGSNTNMEAQGGSGAGSEGLDKHKKESSAGPITANGRQHQGGKNQGNKRGGESPTPTPQ
jgi:hypothetical protein